MAAPAPASQPKGFQVCQCRALPTVQSPRKEIPILNGSFLKMKKNKKKVPNLKNILIFAASNVIKTMPRKAEMTHFQQDIIKQLSINQ